MRHSRNSSLGRMGNTFCLARICNGASRLQQSLLEIIGWGENNLRAAFAPVTRPTGGAACSSEELLEGVVGLGEPGDAGGSGGAAER